MDGYSAWDLPGLGVFVSEIGRCLEKRLALVRDDPAMPDGLAEAMIKCLERDFPVIEEIQPQSDVSPAECIAENFGALPQLSALLSPALDQSLAIIDLSGLDKPAQKAWHVFLQRFAAEAEPSENGVALAVFGLAKYPLDDEGLPVLRWSETLRYGDLIIWAEEHLPANREGLEAEFAVSVSAQMCGWRLDLLKNFVCANIEDLANPLTWLSQRDEAPLPGARKISKNLLQCPLHLLQTESEELERRVWRGQLVALFPWLEEKRISLVNKYRGELKINDHLRSLGVTEVDEIELGALAYQLSGRLNAKALEKLYCLKRLRNSLAHRKPGEPSDILNIISD
jgi:hypothetical protein